ncbi:MAG TPA: hypothetical protein VHW65_05355 [Gemmatimonadales bacterium]|jgi:uncharacterized membrane protein|nr:hypothetical protein [Gemmatimonadales bacterium]
MMNGILHFIHYLAFVMWIGGGLATMVAGIAMKRLERPLWGAIVDVQGAIYRALIGPGAIVVLLSGIVMGLSMPGGMSGQVGPWLGTMQAAGAIGALVTLLGAMPTAFKLSRLDAVGADAPHFDALRKRLAITSSIGGTLALIALLAGALYTHA